MNGASLPSLSPRPLKKFFSSRITISLLHRLLSRCAVQRIHPAGVDCTAHLYPEADSPRSNRLRHKQCPPEKTTTTVPATLPTSTAPTPGTDWVKVGQTVVEGALHGVSYVGKQTHEVAKEAVKTVGDVVHKGFDTIENVGNSIGDAIANAFS